MQTGEGCDDGDDDDTDECLPTCQKARCGDGIVRADIQGVEDCDDGDDDDLNGCANTCVRNQVVFISSDGYLPPDLAGDLCDAHCHALALSAGLVSDGAVFRAWLSSPVRPLTSRIGANGGRYVNVNRELLAESWDELRDQGVRTPVLYNERGEEMLEFIWTGTLASAEASSANCLNWSTDNELETGEYGGSDKTGNEWTSLDWAPKPCSESLPVYCVETH